MKIGIAGTNPADAMLPHQHRRMKVVDHIATDIRQLGQGVPNNRRVTVRRQQQIESWRRQKRFYESPSLSVRPKVAEKTRG